MPKQLIALFTRLLEALLNAINRANKKKAADSPASTIANGGRVQQSDKTFSDLAEQSERDRTE